MNRHKAQYYLRTFAAIAGCYLAGSASGMACAVCYSSVGEHAAGVLRSGILILFLPTMAIFGALLYWMRRQDECPWWNNLNDGSSREFPTNPAEAMERIDGHPLLRPQDPNFR